MQVELLPCPFCGGEAEMLTAESMNGGYLFGIMCNDCRSRGDVYDTEAEAISAWNSRAERTCKIESSYLNDFTSNHECWYEFEMQCGYQFTWDEMEPPNFCCECGAKVKAVKR